MDEMASAKYALGTAMLWKAWARTWEARAAANNTTSPIEAAAHALATYRPVTGISPSEIAIAWPPDADANSVIQDFVRCCLDSKPR